MIIEHYRDQDLQKLRTNVFEVYIKFSKEFEDMQFDLTFWHPEQYGNYNDTWRIISLMERYGYHSYNFDTVLYTSEFQEYDNPEKIISGDGLTFNQAVCNMFVAYGLEYEKRTVNKM